MSETHHFSRRPSEQRWSVRGMLARSLRHAVLRPGVNGQAHVKSPLPESMRRTTDAADLMAQLRETLSRVEDQVVYGGVIFLNAEAIGDLPNPDQAAVHSAPLPPMDFFRWPISALARVAARMVRKFAAPFMRRQERFNLDLLESMRRLEARLETQQHTCRLLRLRIAQLEAERGQRLGSADSQRNGT